MLETGARANCEDCFEGRSLLDSLARQYTAGDHWLQNSGHRMLGNYSLVAIHAIGRRVDIEKPPQDIRGPFLRNDPVIDQDEFDLFFIKAALDSKSLNPRHITMLRDIAQKRKQSYDSFLNKGKKYWDEEAQKAKPFLDRMSNRGSSEDQEKRTRFQRVYWLDQGAFILAKTALGRCSGPWFRMCQYGEKFRRFHVPFPRGDPAQRG